MKRSQQNSIEGAPSSKKICLVGDVVCDICTVRYHPNHLGHHVLISQHKKALLQKMFEDPQVKYEEGFLLRYTPSKIVWDILFGDETTVEDDIEPDFNETDEDNLTRAILNIESYFRKFKNGIVKRVKEGLHVHNTIKMKATLCVKTWKMSEDNSEPIFEEYKLNAKPVVLTLTSNLDEWIQKHAMEMKNRFEEAAHRGSGWRFLQVNTYEMRFNRYAPLSGSSYIQLPQKIQSKKAVINVKNLYDNYCFKYSIAARELHNQKVKNLERPTKYTNDILMKFNFEGLTFPVPFSQFKTFEAKNDASINIYGVEDDTNDIYPLRICENLKPDNHWDLLYLDEIDENADKKEHYCYISDLSRLVAAQKTKHTSKIEICRRCLQHFPSKARLEAHLELCMQFKAYRTVMPKDEKSHISFDKHKFKQKIPYVIYADLEAVLTPVQGNNPASEKSFTRLKQKHEISSYCYYIVCNNEADKTEYHPVLYRGPDAVSHFWRNIRSEVEKIGELYVRPPHKELKITAEERKQMYNQKISTCHICGKEQQSRELVIDHCHLTGKIRGLACSECNIQYQLPNFVPIIFHNGSGYDFKFLISKIYENKEGTAVEVLENEEDAAALSDDDEEADSADEEDDDDDKSAFLSSCKTTKPRKKKHQRKKKTHDDITIIAKNCENFISFDVKITDKIKARFLDSYRFMDSSLAKLVNDLPKDEFAHTKKFYCGEKFDLATRKGVFCYDYITDFSKYDEPQLPPQTAFYNSMTEEHLEDKDYHHALNVFEKLECESLGDYSDHYLRMDVLLLSDVFESFRSLCHQIYDLDPAWVYSAPGLAWQAMLKTTKVKLSLFTDPTMYLFAEMGTRGGYCSASHRYAKANNPLMKNYDPREETSFMLYVDANNLYGKAMSSSLPLSDFQWLEDEEIQNLDIENVSDDADIGYILEVDVDMDPNLHDMYDQFPYFPERRLTSRKGNVKKLVGTLYNKRNYIVHYAYLKSALRNGLKLKKIHRGLKFKQSKWLAEYIDLNTKYRQQATSEFHKTFFKLMNNAVFGKFLESVRMRRDFFITREKHLLQRRINKPNFKDRIILNEDTGLVLVEMGRTTIRLDKFIQADVSFLDISKMVMYDFHYDVMFKTIFPQPGQLQLLYTDTDSLFYHIKTPDLYAELKKHYSYFDFASYDKSHICYDPTNKKVLGKFKDEVEGKIITEFCALRAKLYTFKVDGEEKKKAKGVSKTVVEKHLKFKNYHKVLLSALTNHKKLYHQMTSIRSYQHQVYTIVQNKVSLSADDDKRYICKGNCGLVSCTGQLIATHAWGHKSIPKEEELDYIMTTPVPRAPRGRKRKIEEVIDNDENDDDDGEDNATDNEDNAL